ncbi:hypothetical protein N0V84_006996 [Fusarium piperis]|uniref:Uncharacterized protein n=1 Tax=Fusarium piperis TaxID=1435070 RepID=A0A9W8WAZ0_9HYPO|nr:hypothetical protein N0V84_006996 [Fusarium piperis]
MTMQFTTVSQLFAEIDAATGDVLVVTDVSQQDYADIDPMRLGFERGGMGATTWRTKGSPDRDGAEGDSTGGPKGSGWPTLVIEAGCSRSIESLRNDMEWWFNASDRQVKTVLLVKSDSGSEDITIEKWQAAGLEPSRSQVVTISRGSNTSSVAPTVLGGPLRLDSELLFGREPGQGEHDVVLPVTELQQLAGMVWG